MPSESSTAAASEEWGLESTPRIPREQRDSTSVRGCTSRTKPWRSGRSSREPPAREVSRLQDLYGGRARARLRVPLMWTCVSGGNGASTAGLGRGRRDDGGGRVARPSISGDSDH